MPLPDATCQFLKTDGTSCKRRVATGEKFCWQHATTFIHKWRSLTRNQTVAFWLALIFGLATLLGAYWSYKGYQPSRSQLVHEVHETSFVYLAPGVWFLNNHSWDFLIRHGGGPDPVYNVEMIFYDEDRQKAIATDKSMSIEQLSATLRYPEIDQIEGAWAKQFIWRPLSPDHEHFTVIAASRDGAFRETIRIEGRSEKNWQYAIKVVDDQSKRVLLDCIDPRFPNRTETEQRLPRCFPDYVVPGSTKKNRTQ